MKVKGIKILVASVAAVTALSGWGSLSHAEELENSVCRSSGVAEVLLIVESEEGEVWDVEAENERALALFKEYNEAIDAEDAAIAEKERAATESWIEASKNNVPAEATLNNGIINEFLSGLNEERTALGLEALAMNSNLMRLAESRANAIESNFSHDGATTAECIAFGSTTGLGFVEQFKNSPRHWSILTSNYKAIGIGVKGSYMAVLVTTDEPDGYEVPVYDEPLLPDDYIEYPDSYSVNGYFEDGCLDGYSDYWLQDSSDVCWSFDEAEEYGWD